MRIAFPIAIRMRTTNTAPGQWRQSRRWRFAAVALIAGLALPPTRVSARSAGDASSLVLSGKVCARTSGQPIPNAQIGIAGHWDQAGGDGAYQITLAPAGHLYLRAAAQGYQSSDLVMVSSTDGSPLSGLASFSFCGKLALADAFTSSDDAVRLVPVDQNQPGDPHSLRLVGSTRDALENDAALQLPNGRVILLHLQRQGAVLQCQVPLRAGPGRYVLEINAEAGLALIKLPLFAGIAYRPPPAPPAYVADATGMQIDALRALAFAGINHQRSLAGLPALREDPRLMRETQAHSDDVIVGGFISQHAHIGSNGSTPAQRIQAAGVSFHQIAEDVGSGDTIQEILFGLMESPAHRWAILGNFTTVGIGVARLDSTLILTADFVHA